MSDSLGSRLRRRREERQIDLIAIAEATKIKVSLLEGLERDDVAHWPSGIFRRAYLRAYAQMIGLDPDAVVREFLDAHPDPSEPLVATTAAAAAAVEEAAARGGGSAVRLRTLMDSALGSLGRLRRPPAEDEPRDPAPPAVPAEPAPAGPALPVKDPPAVLAVQPGSPHEAAEEDAAGATPAGRMQDDAGMRPIPQASDGRQSPDADANRDEEAVLSLETVARLCTGLGRVGDAGEVSRLLEETARALHAAGLIVWLWDDAAAGLRPALVHGYSERVLAQLPPVTRDADNATAAAFRTAATCAVAPEEGRSGALVVPMLSADGCAGVLALELRPGVTPERQLRALATVLAAALMQLVERAGAGRVRRPGPASERRKPSGSTPLKEGDE